MSALGALKTELDKIILWRIEFVFGGVPMATIMEKDVLLELVSYSLAMLHNRNNSDERTDSERALCRLKHTLINTDFNDIDYKATTTRIKQLGACSHVSYQ